MTETAKPAPKKKATPPTQRRTRTIKPGTFLKMIENTMAENEIGRSDEVQSLIDVLEQQIIQEAKENA
jgi:hypothetical protein